MREAREVREARETIETIRARGVDEKGKVDSERGGRRGERREEEANEVP